MEEEVNQLQIENQLLKIKSKAAIQSAKIARMIPHIDRFLADEDESAKNEFFAELKRELMKLEIEMVKEGEKNREWRLGILEIQRWIWIVVVFCFTLLCFELLDIFSR